MYLVNYGSIIFEGNILVILLNEDEVSLFPFELAEEKEVGGSDSRKIVVIRLTASMQYDSGVLKWGTAGNTIEFRSDYDKDITEVLARDCIGESLLDFLDRLNNVFTVLDRYGIYTSIENDLRFMDYILKSIFSLDYFCEHVKRTFVKEIVSCYTERYTVGIENPVIKCKFVLAYYYSDIYSNIKSKYASDYNQYHSGVFSNIRYQLFDGLDFIEDIESEVLCNPSLYKGNFIDKLTTFLLDNDFLISAYGISRSDISSKLLNGFCQFFENMDERVFIFNTDFLNQIEPTFTPSQSSLRLATMQNSVDIYFLGALMRYIKSNACVDTVKVGEKLITAASDLSKYYSGHIKIDMFFQFNSVYNLRLRNKLDDLVVNKNVYKSIVPFLKYAWAGCLINMTNTDSVIGMCLKVNRINVDYISTRLSRDKSGVYFRYEQDV